MACLAACGEGLCPEARAVIQTTAPVIDGWLATGYDLAADILPVLQERTLRKRADRIRSALGRISPRRSQSATP